MKSYQGKICLIGLILIAIPAFAEDRTADAVTIKKLVEAASRAAPGTEKLGEFHTGQLAKRATTVVEVQLDRARCYTFIAVGGAGVSDLSLTVSAHGKEVGGDRISGEQPIVKWCSPGRVKASVKIAMYAGSGPFALGVYAEKGDAPASAEKVGGKGNDFISNRIRQLHGQFGKGRAAISALLKGNLSTGNDQVFKVRLRAGHCYTIIGAGSPSVRNLDIVLLDPNGRELDKDASKNNFPTVETDPCLRSGGQYRIKVNMFSGFGQFGLQVFSD